MNKLLIVGFIAAFFSNMASASIVRKVFILKTIDHIALDRTVEGIVDSVTKCTDADNRVIKIESAQGSVVLAYQIAANFVAGEPDILVGVGTSAAQSLRKYASKGVAPLVFSSVTNPEVAGLIGENIFGVSNFIPLLKQVQLFKQFDPRLQKIGVLYNPSELNSVWLIDKLKEATKELGVELVIKPVARTAEITQAATSLVGAVDALFITNDNTVLSALGNVVNVAKRKGLPVYVSDVDAMKSGGLVAAFGPDQYMIGQQTGEMICSILQGKRVEKAIEYPKNCRLLVMQDLAKALNLSVPDMGKGEFTGHFEPCDS